MSQQSPRRAPTGTSKVLEGLKFDPYEEALRIYPRLKGLDIGHVWGKPKKGDSRKLEFWPAGEQGTMQASRPQGLPMDQPGVEMISPDITGEDVAGDIVSHHLVKTDPALRTMYKAFADTFAGPRQRLVDDYDWSRANEGENRPIGDWVQQTRIPDYMRGYVFGQWPEESYPEMYTSGQQHLLDWMKNYIQTPVGGR